MRSLYLDLFDDNLYALTPQAGETGSRDLHAVLSVQLLLSILFRRAVAVPEQWLCSSRVFIFLANDVLRAWRLAHSRAVKYGEVPPPFPFDFSYFSHNDQDPKRLAAMAIRERIERQRPLRLTHSLSWEAPEDYRQPARQGLYDALSDSLSTTVPTFDDRFVNKVSDAIGDAVLADALGSVLRNIVDGQPHQTVRSLGLYNSELRSAVRSVHNALRMNALRDLEDDRTAGFVAFFEEVRDRRIPLHNITGMWDLTKAYDASLRNTITLMGRYCLHRAMGRWTGAGWSASSYSLFSSENPDGYDHLLLATARKAEHLRQSGRGQQDFDQLVVDASAKYGNAKTLAESQALMDTLWARAFAVAGSKEWLATVDKARAFLLREKKLDRHAKIIRDTIVEKLLGSFAELAFAKDPNGEALFYAQFPFLGADPSKFSKGLAQAVVASAAGLGSYVLGAPAVTSVLVAAAASLIGEMLGIHPKIGSPSLALWLSAGERRIKQFRERRD